MAITNQQYLEGLWALGIPPERLRGISTTGRQSSGTNAFLARLQNAGITPAQLDSARRIVEWRPDPKKGEFENTWDLLRNAYKLSDEQIRRIVSRADELGRRPGTRPGGRGTNNYLPGLPGLQGRTANFAIGDLADAVTEVLGPQGSSQFHIKMRLPVPAERAQQYPPNPFRTDQARPQPSPGAPGARGLSEVPAGAAEAGFHWPGPPGQQPLPTPATTGAPSGAGGGGGDGGGGGPVLPPPPAPKLSPTATTADAEKYIRQTYGALSWVLDIPEIKGLLIELAKEVQGEDIPEGKLDARLQGTQWWKNHDQQQRTAIAQRATDPASYKKGIHTEFLTLKALAAQVGLQVTDERLQVIAQTSYDLGWDTVERRSALGNEFDYNPESGLGATDAVTGQLKDLAAQYLIPLSESTIDAWGQKLVSGASNEDGFRMYLREQAKGLYQGMATQLDQGFTVRQLISPYQEMAARTLEVTPEAIDFTDPRYLRFLNQTDPKTGQRTMANLADFVHTLRTDESYGWGRTKAARDQAADVGLGVLRTFGFR